MWKKIQPKRNLLFGLRWEGLRLLFQQRWQEWNLKRARIDIRREKDIYKGITDDLMIIKQIISENVGIKMIVILLWWRNSKIVVFLYPVFSCMQCAWRFWLSEERLTWKKLLRRGRAAVTNAFNRQISGKPITKEREEKRGNCNRGKMTEKFIENNIHVLRTYLNVY